MVDNMEWFNVFGLIFIAVIMIPNVVFAIKCKGYAFVARQQHIHTEKQDYYIDLVFYNYILKCFVLYIIAG